MQKEDTKMEQVFREIQGELSLDIYIEGKEIVIVAETGDGPQYGGERIEIRRKLADLKEEVA
jgi:hypothetical protein